MKKITLLLVLFSVVFLVSCQDTTITHSERNITDINHNSAPYIITVVPDELKDIKNAVNSMQEDDFKEYMYKNHYGAIFNGMNTVENTTLLMEELESTTIPVLDGDEENISKLLFYRDSNCIHQLIIYDSEEIQRSSVRVYTVNSEKAKEMEFEEDVEIVSIKTIETDRYTANLYETRNADYEFFGEITVDDSYIILRSSGIKTMEEFEECFSRLEFIKIGDLMNEATEETSFADKTETTIQEETETEITTEIPEETTLPEQLEAVITE